MSYMIVRTVLGRWYYYWNDEKNKWSGLRDNATEFNTTNVDSYVNLLINRFNDNNITKRTYGKRI